jgi:hypothetical protein
MASDDTPPPPDDAPLTDPPTSPQQKTRRRKYDTNPALDELYRKRRASLRDPSLLASVLKETYSRNEPRLKRIARKYRLLSAIFDEQDLMQEAFFGLLQAFRNYRITPDGEMRFPTFTVWSTKNIYQRAIGSTENLVELYGPDGRFAKLLSYRRYVQQKKVLEAAGYAANTKRRCCYLSEALQDQDLEAKLRDNPGFTYDTEEGAEEEGEATAGAEQDDGEAEPGPDAGTAPPAPVHDGFDFRRIDRLHRRWAGTHGKGPVTQADPVVLDVYDLLRGYGETMLAPFRNNGCPLTDDEVKQTILDAIVQGFASHGRTPLSEIPFSVSLRVAMKRSVQRLHKDKDEEVVNA